MKRVLAVILSIVLMIGITGCGAKNKADKYVETAIDHISKEVGVSLSSGTYYVQINESKQAYSYYSSIDYETVTEYENIIARVYIPSEKAPYPLVVFISDTGDHGLFLSLNEEQTYKTIENSYSGNYLEAHQKMAWKDMQAKNESYVPSVAELDSWIVVEK